MIEIIDNFLEEDEFNKIRDVLMQLILKIKK